MAKKIYKALIYDVAAPATSTAIQTPWVKCRGAAQVWFNMQASNAQQPTAATIECAPEVLAGVAPIAYNATAMGTVSGVGAIAGNDLRQGGPILGLRASAVGAGEPGIPVAACRLNFTTPVGAMADVKVYAFVEYDQEVSVVEDSRMVLA